MTREEAIRELKADYCGNRIICELYPDQCNREECEIWLAIKALETQPEVAKDTNVLINDCISRQAAIDAANEWLLDCFKVQKQDRSCGLIRRLEDLPSAQPDLSSYSDKLWRSAYERGKAEAQAEIVRCKDCKYIIEHQHYGDLGESAYTCEGNMDGWVLPDDFCSSAERRTDGTEQP